MKSMVNKNWFQGQLPASWIVAFLYAKYLFKSRIENIPNTLDLGPNAGGRMICLYITIKSTMFESSNSSNRLIAFLMYVYLWIIPGRSRERALQNLPSSFWSTLAKTDSCKNIELLGGNLAVLIVRASMEPLERRVPVVSSTRFINFLRLVSLILPHCAVKFHRHKNFTL